MAADRDADLERLPLEREPANGPYRGRLEVRSVPLGMIGAELLVLRRQKASGSAARPAANDRLCSHAGCANPRIPGATICATHAARRKSTNRCGSCGLPGHNQRTCRRAR